MVAAVRPAAATSNCIPATISSGRAGSKCICAQVRHAGRAGALQRSLPALPHGRTGGPPAVPPDQHRTRRVIARQKNLAVPPSRRRSAQRPDGPRAHESLADLRQPQERPALRKPFATFPADSKVAAASFAVIPTVVSISDKLPPAAAARIADAAAFSSGNSAITSQSWRPKVKYQPRSLPPTLLNKLLTASSRFSGFASMPLTASVVNFPRDM